jgi:hypothetical protein
VRTDMIAPTKAYDYAPALSVDEAVELVVEAVIHKASRVATANGRFQQVLNVLAPKIHATLMNVVFRMFDDSRAGAPGRRVQDAALPTAEQVALAQLVKGVHY